MCAVNNQKAYKYKTKERGRGWRGSFQMFYVAQKNNTFPTSVNPNAYDFFNLLGSANVKNHLFAQLHLANLVDLLRAGARVCSWVSQVLSTKATQGNALQDTAGYRARSFCQGRPQLREPPEHLNPELPSAWLKCGGSTVTQHDDRSGLTRLRSARWHARRCSSCPGCSDCSLGHVL